MPIPLQDRRLKKTVLNDFSGGLNNRFAQARIQDNQSAALRNYRWRETGALSKRQGTVRHVLTGFTVPRTIFAYQLSAMANENLLIVDSDGAIFKATNDPPSTFTTITGTLGTVFSPEMVIFKNKVYIANGDDLMRSFDDTTLASVAGSPRSRFMAVFKNHLFHFNLDGDSFFSRLRWSDLETPETYTSTNFQDISDNDGAYGTGMKVFGDELILAKGPYFSNQSFDNGSLWRVVGDIFDANNPSYAFDEIPLPKGVAPLFHRSMQGFRGGLVFLTNDGFYFYQGGGSPPIRISDAIQGEVDKFEIKDIHVNTRRAAAFVFKDYYVCSVYSTKDSSDNFLNRLFVWDGEHWFVDTIGNVSGGANVDDFTVGDGMPLSWDIYRTRLYGASPFSNMLRRFETGAFTDDTITGVSLGINASNLTKEFNFDVEQKFIMLYVTLRDKTANSLTFEYNIDQGGVTVVTIDKTTPDTDDIAPSGTSIHRKKVILNKTGRTIQFRFLDMTTTDMECYEVELYHHNARGAVN